LDVRDWVCGAIILMVGAFVIFVIFTELCKVYPDFYGIGWILVMAFITGAALYLKYGVSRVEC
jgi:hypothetical protein